MIISYLPYSHHNQSYISIKRDSLLFAQSLAQPLLDCQLSDVLLIKVMLVKKACKCYGYFHQMLSANSQIFLEGISSLAALLHKTYEQGIYCALIQKLHFYRESIPCRQCYGSPHILCISSNNLGQNIEEKFTKLSKLIFDVLQFFLLSTCVCWLTGWAFSINFIKFSIS